MILQRFRQSYGSQLFFTLLLFIVCSILCYGVFFNGFVSAFNWYNHKFFHTNIPALLSYNPYHEGYSITLSSLLNPYFTIALLALYIPIYIKKQSYKHTITYNRADKIIVFTCAAAIAWELCTYDYNYYLNAAFFLDRIILILLVISLLRTPLTLPLFIAFSLVYRAQFNYPLEGFPLLDKKVLFDLLIMYLVYLYTQLFVINNRVSFTYLVLCIVAANYFVCGAAKLMISPHGYEWIFKNNPAYLFMNMHYRGWMANTNTNTIQTIYNILLQYKVPLQGFVLMLELAPLFLLFNRKASMVLLTLLTIMHIGIFITGSMLFWKWMAIDIALIFILSNKKSADSLFSKKNFLYSILLICLSGIWLHPIKIGWFDTPYLQYMSYEVVDSNNNVYNFNRNNMNPYHQGFQFDDFRYLINQKCIRVSPFGYTNNYQLAQDINNAGAKGIAQLVEQKGENYFNPSLKNIFDIFIRVFFKEYNKKLRHHLIPSLLVAPDHLHTSTANPAYQDQAPIRAFRVVFNQVYTENEEKITITRKIVDEINIPQ